MLVLTDCKIECVDVCCKPKILHFNLCWNGFILFHFDTPEKNNFCTNGVGVGALKYKTVPVLFSLSYFIATVNLE